MITKALLVLLVFWVCRLTVYQMPNLMLDRPIFLGPVIGLVLGDFKTGCLIGAQLELIYLGVVVVGTATSADPGAAVAIAVPLAVINKLSINEAITIAVPIGYACSVFMSLEPLVGELFVPIIDHFMEKDDYRGWTISGLALSFLQEGMLPIGCFIALVLGGEAIGDFVNGLPPAILNGIDVAGCMLPAVGMAILTSQLWNKKTCIYFIFGYFLMKYMGLDVMFLAIIAIFIAVTGLFNNLDNKNEYKQDNAGEEEFF